MQIEICEKTALVAAGRSYSYGELFALGDLLAASFPDGPAKVAIFSENSERWLMALYGGWRARNIIVPVDYLSTPEELAYMLDDCQPALLCCSDKTLQTAEVALKITKNPCKIYNLSQFVIPGEVAPATTGLKRDNSDICLILYTSGTTGTPKGVVLSFGNIQSNIDAVCGREITTSKGERVKGVPIYGADTRCIILLPLHHILPLLGTAVMPLYNGGSVYICPALSGEAIRDIMCTYHITHMVAVPRLYAVICKGIKDIVMSKWITRMVYKLSKSVNSLAFSRKIFKAVQAKFGGAMKYCVCGGAALDPEIARDLRIFGFEILEGYGMTEASPMISFTRPGRTLIGTAGEMMPGVEVSTIDGEVVARGDNIMQGYYNRPEETAAIIKDGWLHTGDLGRVDADGYVTLTGRCKEILVLNNGKNVNPSEIEAKLELASPLIKEAAVLLNRGQLHAILVPDEKAVAQAGNSDINTAIAGQLIEPYNSQTSPAKKLKGFTLCYSELPRTRMGKIKRYQLNALLAELLARDVSQAAPEEAENYSPATKALLDYLSGQVGMTVRLSHHLELDLGLDSLDKISLLSFIQRTYGIECSEQLLVQSFKVGQLADFIEKNMSKMELAEENWQEILNIEQPLAMPQSGLMHSFLKFLATAAARICFRLKLRGRENLPQKPVIIAANHQSYADGLLLSLLMSRRTFKKTVFLAKEQHFSGRLRSYLARHCNIIVMDINANIKESMQKMAQALKKGYNVCIFPEGTRTTTGTLSAFKRGFAIVGAELGVPIVPAVIKGAEKAMPKGHIFPKIFAKISVSFLPPVEAKDKDYQVLTSYIQEEIATELNKAA